MKKISFTISLLIMSLMLNVPVKAADTSSNLSIDPSCSYILMDSRTGQILAENNSEIKVRPASTTKILTAIVALEEGNLDQVVSVSQQAVYDIGDGGMNIGIMAGEDNLTLENMLNVMLVKSANETANIIAENVAVSRQEYIKRMNERAAELGAVDTTFFNTCGMDDTAEYKNHLSTAKDMAILARHAMTIDKFREIVAKEYYDGLPATNKHKEWPALRNTNKLLWGNNEYSYGENEVGKYKVIGIKTGYTSGAGHNLISAAVNEDGIELIAAVLNVKGNNEAIQNYTKQLYKYGFENFKKQNIVSENEVVRTVTVTEAKDDGILELVASEPLAVNLPLDKNSWNLQEFPDIKTDIEAPVKQGEVLGTVEYRKDGIILGKIDLLAARGVEKSIKETIKDSSKSFFEKVLSSWIFRLLFISVSVLLIRKHIRRARYRKRRRRYMENRFK